MACGGPPVLRENHEKLNADLSNVSNQQNQLNHRYNRCLTMARRQTMTIKTPSFYTNAVTNREVVAVFMIQHSASVTVPSLRL